MCPCSLLYVTVRRQGFQGCPGFWFYFSCFAFLMIPGAERFTGHEMMYGLGIFLIAAVFYAGFCGALLYCCAWVELKHDSPRSIIFNSISAASFFCIAEALLMQVSRGFPWLDVHAGNGLAKNLYAIQPVSFFGIYILTFVVIAVNYLVAVFILKKSWIKLYIPLVIVIGYVLAGFGLYMYAHNRMPASKSFKVAILSENILPDIKWDENSGNLLVQKLLDLNYLAITLKPAIAFWSESAIPWTYRKDDDLVKEVFKITDTARITHIMGINTAYAENEVFNSAYCMLPGGTVTGRYDKQYLLSFIEKPLNGWLMPFFSSKGFVARTSPDHGKPLTTPYGKAGFLICNEAAIPAAAAQQVMKGAEFLMNMSNDGWFNDTYIVNLHFYYARLRAVESQKDIAINCNNGYSGLIKASGEIELKEQSTEPYVKMVTIQPNRYRTVASTHPRVFIYICIIFIASVLVSMLIKKHLRGNKSL
ncbi:MAG: apolipoprotein N-acyltransferase [Ferruginibacter sp.]